MTARPPARALRPPGQGSRWSEGRAPCRRATRRSRRRGSARRCGPASRPRGLPRALSGAPGGRNHGCHDLSRRRTRTQCVAGGERRGARHGHQPGDRNLVRGAVRGRRRAPTVCRRGLTSVKAAAVGPRSWPMAAWRPGRPAATARRAALPIHSLDVVNRNRTGRAGPRPRSSAGVGVAALAANTDMIEAQPSASPRPPGPGGRHRAHDIAADVPASRGPTAECQALAASARASRSGRRRPLRAWARRRRSARGRRARTRRRARPRAPRG